MRYAKHLFDVFLLVAAFALLQGTIILLYNRNPLLFALVLIQAAVALRLWHEPHDVVFFVVIAVLGSAAEAVFVHFDVWHYANPTALGVPLWFPVAFGLAALIGQRIARAILALWRELESRRASAT